MMAGSTSFLSPGGAFGGKGSRTVCFSATASYVSGVTIGAIGVATLPLVPERRQRMFAALPLVFAVHQLLEGVIWDQIERSGGNSVRSPAVELWLLIAWLVFPIWVPLSARLFEPDERRRRWMLALAGVGVLIGGYLAVESMLSSTAAVVNGHHLEFAIDHGPGWLLAIPYVAATCLPLLLSSHRFVVAFGAVMTISMAATALLDSRAFSSVWCFFAALLSAGLFVHYLTRRLEARARPSTPGTAGAAR